jgi:hypothetical protein
LGWDLRLGAWKELEMSDVRAGGSNYTKKRKRKKPVS